MRKIRSVILCIILFVLITNYTGCAIQSEYPPPGRNTREWFGDGRFEIFSGQSDLSGDYRYYCLYDRKDDNGAIEGNILVYEVYDKEVYVIGLEGNAGQAEAYGEAVLKLEEIPEKLVYTKLNYESGELKQSEDISSFEENEQAIFNKLLNSKTLHE